MSRISLNSRIRAIIDAAERIDPFAAKVHRLPPALRLRYDAWRAECEAIGARYERDGGPGAYYEAMLDGKIVASDPPRDVATALGLAGAPVLLDTMSAAEVGEIWRRMVEGGRTG